MSAGCPDCGRELMAHPRAGGPQMRRNQTVDGCSVDASDRLDCGEQRMVEAVRERGGLSLWAESWAERQKAKAS